jgi:hypothetical protein
MFDAPGSNKSDSKDKDQNHATLSEVEYRKVAMHGGASRAAPHVGIVL